jgi:hypothetical protein
VGGLSHYLEAAGIATTQISLIREHTETIRPPRALWVPFPLGRPLGIPNNPEFQRDVLLHALRLLEAAEGPVLQDYPRDAEAEAGDPAPLACPVNFAAPPELSTDLARLLHRFRTEVATMATWYAVAGERGGRATAAVSGLAPAEIAALFADFLEGRGCGQEGRSLADLLRQAAEDLRSCYFEALLAQPGQSTDPQRLAAWFWGETCAARVINAVRQRCLADPAKEMRLLGRLLLIPRSQMHRFGG